MTEVQRPADVTNHLACLACLAMEHTLAYLVRIPNLSSQP